jgi:hypothetical protein
MRYVVRAVLGGIVVIPWLLEGRTLGQFAVSFAFAVGIALCLPDDWLD